MRRTDKHTGGKKNGVKREEFAPAKTQFSLKRWLRLHEEKRKIEQELRMEYERMENRVWWIDDVKPPQTRNRPTPQYRLVKALAEKLQVAEYNSETVHKIFIHPAVSEFKPSEEKSGMDKKTIRKHLRKYLSEKNRER